MAMLRVSRLYSFGIAFDNIKEFWQKAMEGQIPPEFHVLNWNTIKVAALPQLGKVLNKKKMPEPIKEGYRKLEYLTGLHGFRVIVGNRLLDVSFRNLPVLAVLPTWDEIVALKEADD